MRERIKQIFENIHFFFATTSKSRQLLLFGFVILVVAAFGTAVYTLNQTVFQQHAQTPGHYCALSGGGCYDSCPNGDQPGGTNDCGYLGTYCCVPKPLPTVTFTPTPSCSTLHHGGTCTSSGICSTNGGVSYGSTGCNYTQVCCTFSPTPTPLPKMTCDSSHTFSTAYGSGTGSCVNNTPGSPGYNGELCNNADFYPGPSTCTNNGNIGVCCHTNSVLHPTPRPSQHLPSGTSCTGQAVNSSMTEHGVCFFPRGDDGSTNGNDYTTDKNQACSSGCPTSGWYSSCTTMLTKTNGVQTDGHSIPNNNSCQSIDKNSVCCALNTSNPAPTPTSLPDCFTIKGGGCYYGGCPVNYTAAQGTCGTSGSQECCIPNTSTPTVTGGGATDTPAPTVTGGGATDTPAPACQNGNATVLTLKVTLPGIGSGQYDNHSPRNTALGAAIDIVNPDGSIFTSFNANLTFDGTTYNVSNMNLGNNLACGTAYKVRVAVPRYLHKFAGTLNTGNSNTLSTTLIAGDVWPLIQQNGVWVVQGDNKLDISDYNIFNLCYNHKITDAIPVTDGSGIVASCDVANIFDYSDTNTVLGGEPYNLFLRGEIAACAANTSCQGD